MQPEHLALILPARWRVTLLTTDPELPLMHIGVAISACSPNPPEFQILMTGDAVCQGVASQQREAGFIMIEVWRPPNFVE